MGSDVAMVLRINKIMKEKLYPLSFVILGQQFGPEVSIPPGFGITGSTVSNTDGRKTKEGQSCFYYMIFSHRELPVPHLV